MKRECSVRRLLVVVMMSMVTLAGMAQMPHGPRPGGRGPEGRHDGRRHERVECATPDQMKMVIKAMKKESFDDGRLELGKLCVVLGHFCTNDLYRMAEMFSFDDNRLAFLEYAYRYCEDPENYYSLKDVFSFQSNFDKLMDSVQPRGRRR